MEHAVGQTFMIPRKCSLSKFTCYVLQFASKHPNKGILCEFVPAKKQQVSRIGYQNWMTYTCHVRYLSAKTHNIEQLVRVTPSKTTQLVLFSTNCVGFHPILMGVTRTSCSVQEMLFIRCTVMFYFFVRAFEHTVLTHPATA